MAESGETRAAAGGRAPAGSGGRGPAPVPGQAVPDDGAASHGIPEAGRFAGAGTAPPAVRPPADPGGPWDSGAPLDGGAPWDVREGWFARARWGVRAYGFIVAMWVRSTLAYRTSFLLMALGNLLSTGLDFVAIVIMFTHVEGLAGFTLPEVAFFYATVTLSFGLADLLLGSFDRIGSRVRDGTVDTLLVRPVPVLAQVAADRFGLHRIGRPLQALCVLGWSLWQLEVDWTVAKVALLPVMLLSGTVIFAAVFVVGGAFQFWAQDAAEVQNSFTYGGTTMLEYPPAVFGKEVVRAVTFVVPLAFVNWVPALHVLGRDDPLGLPSWADLLSPAVAVLCGAVAGAAWRAGLRSYVSTGS